MIGEFGVGHWLVLVQSRSDPCNPAEPTDNEDASQAVLGVPKCG